MISRREAIQGLAGIAAFTATSCNPFPAHFRFRLKVEVDTPTGMRIGSSVMEVTGQRQPRIGGSPSVAIKLRGEAVALDLAVRSTLFALIEETLTGDIMRGFIPYNGSDYWMSTIQQLGSSKADGRTLVLTRSQYPRLVRFRDIRDPRTVEAVDPDNLAASFGPGTALRAIVATITDNPVMTGIEKRLPSFGPESGFNTWLRSLPISDPRRLTLNNFKRGD